MNKTEIEDIKQTIEWLLHNGDFKDTETAYNSAMNSINTLKEAINFTDSCEKLKDKNVLTFEEWLIHFKKTEDNNYWLNKETLYCKEAMKFHYDNLPDE